MKLLKAALLALCLSPLTQAADVPGRFDFYVLSLSWSPDYCASRPQDGEQCGRRFGFVLHGLWPQYERGYPADCTAEPLDPAMLQHFAGLYPSRKLFRHEWQKHGSCSGLDQQGYHQLSAQLKQRFVAPAMLKAPEQPLRFDREGLKQALQASNPWLSKQAISLSCSGSGRFLQEVRLCVDKAGKQARACSAQMQAAEARSCKQPDFLVRSVR